MKRFRLHVIEIDDIGRAKNNGAILGIVDCDESDFAESAELGMDLSRLLRDELREVTRGLND